MISSPALVAYDITQANIMQDIISLLELIQSYDSMKVIVISNALPVIIICLAIFQIIALTLLVRLAKVRLTD